jgi:SAM-dependent methyltransferase
MDKYFDKNKKRLVFINKASNPEFWDMHWDKFNPDINYPEKNHVLDFVIRSTNKFLPKGSTILEGGCGMGQEVCKLQKAGFRTIGVDFAIKTVNLVNKIKPELDVRYGDVCKLDFENNFFDGYWSFGVIEHFYDGFQPILLEMKRVIKPGGYLFITFPHISFLRKIKAKLNAYPNWDNNPEKIESFYQFALDSQNVKSEFQKNGFIFIKKQHLSGLKGLKDEVEFLKKPLQKIYDSKNLFGKAIGKIISIIFNRFSSHSILLIFKNA